MNLQIALGGTCPSLILILAEGEGKRCHLAISYGGTKRKDDGLSYQQLKPLYRLYSAVHTRHDCAIPEAIRGRMSPRRSMQESWEVVESCRIDALRRIINGVRQSPARRDPHELHSCRKANGGVPYYQLT